MNECPDGWKVIGNLGQGGQGKVRKVQGLDNPKQLGSLKILRKQFDKKKSKKARMRFHNEVTILKSLDVAGVPRLLESNYLSYEDQTVSLFAIFEFIDGVTLDEYIKSNGPIDLESSIALTVKLINIVEYLNDEETAHRDIKPQNIVLRNSILTDPVLIDFGIAKLQNSDVDLTEIGEPLGNRFLALPELKGPSDHRADTRTDLSCCCGILFYCLTGFKPGQPLNDRNEPPHLRTEEKRALEKVVDTNYRLLLNGIFDIGFANHIDRRHQSALGLKQSLVNLLSLPSTIPLKPEPDLIKALLAALPDTSQRELEAEALKQGRELLYRIAEQLECDYRLEQFGGHAHRHLSILTYDIGIEFKHPHHDLHVVFLFQITLRGTEIVFEHSPHMRDFVEIGREPYSGFHQETSNLYMPIRQEFEKVIILRLEQMVNGAAG